MNVHVYIRGRKSFMQYFYLLNHLYHSLRKILLKLNGTKPHNERKDSIVILEKMNNPLQGNIAYDRQFLIQLKENGSKCLLGDKLCNC